MPSCELESKSIGQAFMISPDLIDESEIAQSGMLSALTKDWVIM